MSIVGCMFVDFLLIYIYIYLYLSLINHLVSPIYIYSILKGTLTFSQSTQAVLSISNCTARCHRRILSSTEKYHMKNTNKASPPLYDDEMRVISRGWWRFTACWRSSTLSQGAESRTLLVMENQILGPAPCPASGNLRGNV